MYCNDPEDRRDLFQEIVFQLWKSFPGFRQESSVSTWMYRVGMNTAISHFRKGKQRPQPVSFTKFGTELPELIDTEENAPEMVILYQAIDLLSVIEKSVILLYLDDKSYEEMATILGIGKSNVGVKLNRIKTKLEKLVKSITL